MHLKNYSLYSPDGRDYQLTPTYDLLSTALILPKYSEELALTLCGRKQKLTRQNFISAMTESSLNEKVCANMFKKFERVAPRWQDFIRRSFISAEMQEQYISFINSRLAQLGEC
jgi:serine/threonine-protein kinase HipA